MNVVGDSFGAGIVYHLSREELANIDAQHALLEDGRMAKTSFMHEGIKTHYENTASQANYSDNSAQPGEAKVYLTYTDIETCI